MPIWSPGRYIPTQKIPKCPPRDGHPPKTDTSLLRTVSFVPGQRKLLRVAEPDLQIKGKEGGGGHPDPEIRGTGSSHKKNFFDPASVWSQNKGRGGGWIRHCLHFLLIQLLTPLNTDTFFGPFSVRINGV